MHIKTTHSQKVQSKRGEYASIYEWTPHKCMGKSDQGSPIHLRRHSTRDSTYNALFFSIFSFVPFEPKIFCWCLEIFITFLFFTSFSPVCRSSLFWPFYTFFFSFFKYFERAYSSSMYWVCRCVPTNWNLCADFAVHLRLRKESFKKEITNEPTNRRRRAGSLPMNRLHNERHKTIVKRCFISFLSIDMEKKNSIS